MSHFYGTVKGADGEATRQGFKATGITTHAATWKGAIRVDLVHDVDTGVDHYLVKLVPWQGTGELKTLATGEIT
jgi:hypothetical protein